MINIFDDPHLISYTFSKEQSHVHVNGEHAGTEQPPSSRILQLINYDAPVNISINSPDENHEYSDYESKGRFHEYWYRKIYVDSVDTKRNAASTQSQILNNNDIGTQKAQNLSMSNK